MLVIEATVFDEITNGFVTALQSGTQTLAVFSIPLLGYSGSLASRPSTGRSGPK